MPKRKKTSYDYAVSAIQFEVFNWKKRLETHGVLSFKNIGTFRLNADANLVFTAEDNNNYLTTSFGLSPFVSPIVKRELFEKAVEAKTLVQEPVIKHTLAVTTEEEEEEENKWSTLSVFALCSHFCFRFGYNL